MAEKKIFYRITTKSGYTHLVPSDKVTEKMKELRDSGDPPLYSRMEEHEIDDDNER